MSYLVGSKGQVVISKEIRDSLGVRPGWVALQRQVDDHLEVYFLPPEHRKSLKGSLGKYINADISPGEDWDKVREFAWHEAAAAGEARLRERGK
jgi:bifunctional DNA-binding transcriptional regulator/antitoxin component of YhaV-PrlF toxin-antitoxin module